MSARPRGKVVLEFGVLSEEDLRIAAENRFLGAELIRATAHDLVTLTFNQMMGRSGDDKLLAIKLMAAAMTAHMAALHRDLELAIQEQNEDKEAAKEPAFTPEQESNAKDLAELALAKFTKGGEA